MQWGIVGHGGSHGMIITHWQAPTDNIHMSRRLLDTLTQTCLLIGSGHDTPLTPPSDSQPTIDCQFNSSTQQLIGFWVLSRDHWRVPIDNAIWTNTPPVQLNLSYILHRTYKLSVHVGWKTIKSSRLLFWVFIGQFVVLGSLRQHPSLKLLTIDSKERGFVVWLRLLLPAILRSCSPRLIVVCNKIYHGGYSCQLKTNTSQAACFKITASLYISGVFAGGGERAG